MHHPSHQRLPEVRARRGASSLGSQRQLSRRQDPPAEPAAGAGSGTGGRGGTDRSKPSARNPAMLRSDRQKSWSVLDADVKDDICEGLKRILPLLDSRATRHAVSPPFRQNAGKPETARAVHDFGLRVSPSICTPIDCRNFVGRSLPISAKMKSFSSVAFTSPLLASANTTSWSFISLIVVRK
jgi:hypothetical protein